MAPKSRARPAPGVISQELEDETILFEIEEERFFTLDDIGSRAWRLLCQGSAPGEIQEALLVDYDVDPERMSRDIHALFRELQDRGLIIPELV